MIAVVAAVRGQIEGDGKPFLTGGKIAAIKGIRIFGRGETRILADRPGLRDVHGRVRSAQIRRDAGKSVEEVE